MYGVGVNVNKVIHKMWKRYYESLLTNTTKLKVLYMDDVCKAKERVGILHKRRLQTIVFIPPEVVAV